MESAARIRRLVLSGERSMRSLSRETGLSRNTIKKYVNDPSPPSYRRTSPAVRHKLRDFEDRLRLMWEQDQQRHRRERRTALKLYEQLVGEGYTGSYSPVFRYVKSLRSTASSSSNAYIPLLFKAGDALQFDWSEEHVVLGGVERKIKVAHFRLCYSRKSFVIAYPNESQEMVLDAFTRALDFYGGVPKRVIIDNPKTMVTYVSRSKSRIFHPRFMALMNHYAIEPVACTPASGWEKGQIENQVQNIRRWLFTPKLKFDDLDCLNEWLGQSCINLAARPHPEQKVRTIAEIFEGEQAALRPLGQAFDGYVERTTRVLSTCLVQYDSNRYSVPSDYAGKPVSLRAYADRIMVVSGVNVIAQHKRCFERNTSTFEPWHYVPLLSRKPGALRNGAPFEAWQLPASMAKIKDQYIAITGGDRDFVNLLLLVQEHDINLVEMACELALEYQTTRLPAIINLMHQLIEPVIEPLPVTHTYPQLSKVPEADCKRYEILYTGGIV